MRLKTLKPRLQAANLSRVDTVINPSSWRNDGMTSAQRGYGYKWQQARSGYLNRHPLCVMCERDGMVTAATVVDHIIPHRGDMAKFWDSANWQSLCKPCHDGEKAREEAKG